MSSPSNFSKSNLIQCQLLSSIFCDFLQIFGGMSDRIPKVQRNVNLIKSDRSLQELSHGYMIAEFGLFSLGVLVFYSIFSIVIYSIFSAYVSCARMLGFLFFFLKRTERTCLPACFATAAPLSFLQGSEGNTSGTFSF